jgi:hypothetical protein
MPFSHAFLSLFHDKDFNNKNLDPGKEAIPINKQSNKKDSTIS